MRSGVLCGVGAFGVWGRRCFSVYARVACLLPFLGVFLHYSAKLSQLPLFFAVWGFYSVPVVGYAVRVFL